MKVQVYLVDMVSEAPMGAEARLNGSSTIAAIKNYKRLYWTSICPVSVEFVQVFAGRAGFFEAVHNTKDKY